MVANELQALCDLFMLLGSHWPLSQRNKEVLYAFADKQALGLGFENWVDAYHRIRPMAELEAVAKPLEVYHDQDAGNHHKETTNE